VWLNEEEAELTWTMRISSLLISDHPQMLQLPVERSNKMAHHFSPRTRTLSSSDATSKAPSDPCLELLQAKEEGFEDATGLSMGEEVGGVAL
jgi:hypothetical protein